ncbi:MAG TPA: biotin carboxylase N-terminal domain-containing protein [Acidimicrobiia bacterium]|nr:biotin carboxylase N-terminal domain-containing protein [Acidimicrobiia bacterium]
MRPSITKLLVANRGESARRIFRTARDMGIATVAVFTEVDRDAPFVADADEAVALDRLSERGPAAYLDGPALVEAAGRSGADAVHPGYGRLPEDPGFAWRCAEAGLLFVGPSPESIATLGSKLEAKELAAEADVPVLSAEEVDGYPPGKLEAAAEVLGWPVAVKASAGSGGRAMRVVRDGDDLVTAVEAVRREATAAFGDGTVFFEPWLEEARRIDVQVFADGTGRGLHLFERDCTVGRHHQPVIVEAPAPKLAQSLRERLVTAALAVADAAGYVGAGTVEFLVSGDQFWFVEMNCRLEVSHPVTEAILGLDLVAMQLAVAEGRPLPVEARHCSPSGHAIGVRLCIEDPAEGHRIPAGLLRRFEIDPLPGLRVETGLASGAGIGADDFGLATITAFAATRTEAVRRLATALEGLRVHGPRSNREQLLAALRQAEFGAGTLDAAFLDRHAGASAVAGGGAEAMRLHAVAATLACLIRSPAGSASFTGPAGEWVEVAYRLDGSGTVTDVAVDGGPLPGLRIGGVTADAVDLEVDGLRRRVSVARDADVFDCDSRLGHTELVLRRVCYEA